MNSRNKGKRGEREFASLLREHGYAARRGQQFSGSPESPDVVCEALAWLHVEVKRVQNLNLTDACVQAEGDCSGKPWIVAHRRNHAPWLITMRAEFFFDLIREFEPQSASRTGNDATGASDTKDTKDGSGAQGTARPTKKADGPAVRPYHEAISAEDMCLRPTTKTNNTERQNV